MNVMDKYLVLWKRRILPGRWEDNGRKTAVKSKEEDPYSNDYLRHIGSVRKKKKVSLEVFKGNSWS